MLFNDQDLFGWDTYLGPEWIQTSDSIFENRGFRRLKHRPQKYFFSGKRRSTTSDPSFRGAMGGISITQEYENDHLKLDFKWGQTKYRPKENNKRHSGLLYHAVGNHGADGGFWMRS